MPMNSLLSIAEGSIALAKNMHITRMHLNFVISLNSAPLLHLPKLGETARSGRKCIHAHIKEYPDDYMKIWTLRHLLDLTDILAQGLEPHHRDSGGCEYLDADPNPRKEIPHGRCERLRAVLPLGPNGVYLYNRGQCHDGQSHKRVDNHCYEANHEEKHAPIEDSVIPAWQETHRFGVCKID